MSEYGRLWQQVADIRQELKRMFPGSNTNSLAEARETCQGDAGLMVVRHRLLIRWADLEHTMENADD